MDAADRILSAWLATIADGGWGAARIDRVARRAEVPVDQVARVLPDRFAALGTLFRALDIVALGEFSDDGAATVRDQLFGMIMAGFDFAQNHRAAIVELSLACRRDPALGGFLGVRLAMSVARLGEAAGIGTTGLAGPIRVQALVFLILAATRTWLADDSVDLSATMKRLDDLLARLEPWARRLQGGEVTTPRTRAAVPVAAHQSSAGLPVE